MGWNGPFQMVDPTYGDRFGVIGFVTEFSVVWQSSWPGGGGRERSAVCDRRLFPLAHICLVGTVKSKIIGHELCHQP
jgi:hypothetical protein